MDTREIARVFRDLLRLETQPVAMRFVPRGEELKRKPLPFKLNICQLISMARHQGRVSVGVPSSMVCSIGAACTGLIDTPAPFRDGTAAVGKYVADMEAGRTFFGNTFKLGDTGAGYDALMFAPLGEAAGFTPDVVLFYGNPAQIMRLVHATLYRTGEKVSADTVAEAAVCSAAGYALATGRPAIGFPCAGDRRFGGTQNHELVFVTPFDRIEGMAEALQELAEAGPLFPIPPNVMWTPSMPPAYTIGEEDLPGGRGESDGR
jgi:uncharacterized protein (DUF169 family)